MSPTRKQLKLSTAIREAAQWHVRLRDAALNDAQRREFRAWLQSSLNAREMRRICVIHALLRHVPLQGCSGQRMPANVIRFESYAPAAKIRAREPEPARAARRFSVAKVAAAAAGLVAATVATMMAAGLPSRDQALVTERGHWDKQLLKDGTAVYTGPATKLRVHFDDKMRSVALLRGEALFDVAKEPGRPFVVATAVGSVKAVGTEFSTAYQGDSVVVTVTEGKVAVSPAAGQSVQPIIPLVANQQVVLSRRGAGQPVAVNAEREVKWIRNWYDFHGETVCEIVEQQNRRHDVKLVVVDPQICRLRLATLAFKPSEVDDFVAQTNRWYAAFPDQAPQNNGVALRVEQP